VFSFVPCAAGTLSEAEIDLHSVASVSPGVWPFPVPRIPRQSSARYRGRFRIGRSMPSTTRRVSLLGPFYQHGRSVNDASPNAHDVTVLREPLRRSPSPTRDARGRQTSPFRGSCSPGSRIVICDLT